MLGTKGLKPVDKDSQETCINVYKPESYAKVYTCEPSMLSHMEKLREQHPDDVKLASSDGYANTYHVPKKWVVVRAPRKGHPIIVTEEGKQKQLEALARSRAARLKTE